MVPEIGLRHCLIIRGDIFRIHCGLVGLFANFETITKSLVRVLWSPMCDKTFRFFFLALSTPYLGHQRQQRLILIICRRLLVIRETTYTFDSIYHVFNLLVCNVYWTSFEPFLLMGLMAVVWITLWISGVHEQIFLLILSPPVWCTCSNIVHLALLTVLFLYLCLWYFLPLFLIFLAWFFCAWFGPLVLPLFLLLGLSITDEQLSSCLSCAVLCCAFSLPLVLDLCCTCLVFLGVCSSLLCLFLI